MSEDSKICQINIYRKESDTPIVLYDKTDLSESDIINHLKCVFSSPKIAVVTTSSETLIIKPSQIDAIGFIDNINIKKKNKLSKKDEKLSDNRVYTKEIIDSSIKNENVIDSSIEDDEKEIIDIENFDVNGKQILEEKDEIIEETSNGIE